MTWFERIKYTWKTFIKEAPILYGWYLIFFVVAVIVITIGIVAGMFFLRSSPEFLSVYSGIANYSAASLPFETFPSSGLEEIIDQLSSSAYLPLIGFMLIFCMAIFLFSVLTGSLFMAGAFNLTHKTLESKPSFRDFKFSGCLRFLAWVGTITLLTILISIIGLIGFVLLVNMKGLLVTYLIIYFVLLMGLGIYLMPWFSSAPYYLLAHRENKFWQTFHDSFTFFRANMGKLWGLIGAVFLVSLALAGLHKISPVLYWLGSLVATPFSLILPIVWVMTLIEEQRPPISTQPVYSSPYPSSEPSVTPLSQEYPEPARTPEPESTPDPEKTPEP